MIDLGTKVEYKSGDKWLPGVVHAVKKAEATKGPDIILGYLVDTGNDEHVDKFKRDKRDDFIMDEANKIVDDPKNPITSFAEAAADVQANAKLPKSEKYTETMRQPEQVEVLPDDIRAVK